MSLDVSHSLRAALAVKKELWKQRGRITKDASLLIESYQNGREQGIQVWDMNKSVSYSIAMFRRSDDIVVYFGTYMMQSLSDDAYENARFFTNAKDAATFIVEHVNMRYSQKEEKEHTNEIRHGHLRIV